MEKAGVTLKWEPRGKLEAVSPVHDLGVRLLRSFRTEWRVADHHLVHDHTKRPPVAGFVIACLEKHLWCDVVRGSHCGIGKCSSRRFPALGPGQTLQHNIRIFLKSTSSSHSLVCNLHCFDQLNPCRNSPLLRNCN